MPYRTAPLPEPPRRRHRLRAGLRRLSRRLRLRLAPGPRWVRCYYCNRWRRPWRARRIGFHPVPGHPIPAYACRSEQWHAPGCLPLDKVTGALRACGDFGMTVPEANERLARVGRR